MAKWKIQRRIPKDHHRQFEIESLSVCMLVQLQYGAAAHNAWTRVFTGTLSRMMHVSTQEVPVRPLFPGKEQEKSGLGGSVRGKLVLRSPGQGKSHCEDSTGVEALKRDQGPGKD